MSNLKQLQLLQQNLQNVLVQKQQVQTQLLEVESAAKQLESTSSAYKLVGKIMIAFSTSSLLQELQEKKEVIQLRLKTISAQEQKLQGTIETVQQDVVKELGTKSQEPKD